MSRIGHRQGFWTIEILSTWVILEYEASLGTSCPFELGQAARPSGDHNLSPHHLLEVWGAGFLEQKSSSFLDGHSCSHTSH